MRAVEAVVMKEGIRASSTLVTGVIGASASKFAASALESLSVGSLGVASRLPYAHAF